MKTVKTRKWKSFDHDAFRADLANTFPDAETASANAEDIGDVDILVECYDSTISCLLVQHAPPTEGGDRQAATGSPTTGTTMHARMRGFTVGISSGAINKLALTSIAKRGVIV